MKSFHLRVLICFLAAAVFSFLGSQEWMSMVYRKEGRLLTTGPDFHLEFKFGVYASVQDARQKDLVYRTNERMQGSLDRALRFVSEGEIEEKDRSFTSMIRKLEWVTDVTENTVMKSSCEGLEYSVRASGRFKGDGPATSHLGVAWKSHLVDRLRDKGIILHLISGWDLYPTNSQRRVTPFPVRFGDSSIRLVTIERISWMTWLGRTMAYFVGGTVVFGSLLSLGLEWLLRKFRHG